MYVIGKSSFANSVKFMNISTIYLNCRFIFFFFSRKTNETTNWRCSNFIRFKCKSRAITRVINGVEMVKVSKPQHTHPIDPFDYGYVEYLEPDQSLEQIRSFQNMRHALKTLIKTKNCTNSQRTQKCVHLHCLSLFNSLLLCKRNKQSQTIRTKIFPLSKNLLNFVQFFKNKKKLLNV